MLSTMPIFFIFYQLSIIQGEKMLSPMSNMFDTFTNYHMFLTNEGWSNLCWSSDAKDLVSFFNSVTESGPWFSYHIILRLRKLFQEQNWTLTWSARESNHAADLVAKLTSFLFFESERGSSIGEN